MMKIKFTSEFYKKQRRIENLPKFYVNMMMGKTKKDAIEFIKLFQQGIKYNELGLIKLKDGTIKQKKNMNYKKPETPLYGAGLDIDNKTYINMLRVKKLKNGWKVYPSWGKHHKSKLPLRALLEIHENGKIINTKNGIIKIPARPVFKKTKQRYLSAIAKYSKRPDIKKAIKEYIKSDKIELINKIARQVNQGKKYENDN